MLIGRCGYVCLSCYYMTMKFIFFLFAAMVIAIAVHAQEHSNPAAADAYIVAFYTPGSAWNKSKPANEQKYFTEHSNHLSDLRKSNKIEIGGRYSDKMILFFKVKSEDEAKSLIESDEAVKNKLFKVELYPFSTFFKGCLH